MRAELLLHEGLVHACPPGRRAGLLMHRAYGAIGRSEPSPSRRSVKLQLHHKHFIAARQPR
jgi:hypothetical protein